MKDGSGKIHNPDVSKLYDSLTNLPNFSLLYDRAQQAIAMAKRHKKIVVFFLLK